MVSDSDIYSSDNAGDFIVITSDCSVSESPVTASFSGTDGDVSKSAGSVVSDSDGNESDSVKDAVITNSVGDDSDITEGVCVSNSYVVSPKNPGFVSSIIS